MKMMGEHMEEMADRMKSGQAMTPDEMKTMREHMKAMEGSMPMGRGPGMRGKGHN